MGKQRRQFKRQWALETLSDQTERRRPTLHRTATTTLHISQPMNNLSTGCRLKTIFHKIEQCVNVFLCDKTSWFLLFLLKVISKWNSHKKPVERKKIFYLSIWISWGLLCMFLYMYKVLNHHDWWDICSQQTKKRKCTRII